MLNYYNEIDKYCVQWLKNLISEGLIPKGDVDDRDIREVPASDLEGYTQCHFFAGLGGWPYALKLAGWPDNRPVWTGSCPCQSFSNAGKRGGISDKDRHLWPTMSALIGERKPPIFFGEQVKSAIGYGWLDAVASDLEAQAYAFGSAVLPACGVGAPHRRDRIWFVGYSCSASSPILQNQLRDFRALSESSRPSGDVAHSRRDGRKSNGERPCPQEEMQGEARQQRVWIETANSGQDVAHSRGRESLSNPNQQGLSFRECSPLGTPQGNQKPERQNSPGGEWWAIEPNVGRVAHGIPARVGKLRALGNAIVPQVAAEFIKATITLDDADQISHY